MRKAALLSILMIISIAGTGTATTETSPTIDGDFSDWDSDEDVQTDAGKTLYFTWDSNYIYIGWDGTNWASDGDFFLYIDTGTGGSSTTKAWDGTHTLPFAADYGLIAGGGDYHQLIDYNDASSQWDNAGSNPGSSDVYWGWGSDDDTEIRISRSHIGSPTSMSMVVYAQWESAQNIWASFPNQNPASGSGSETLTHYFKVASLTSGIAPDAIPVKENCAAGQYSSDNFDSCTPCPAGTFQPYTGKSWCTTAWGGQYATGTGNTGQSACAARQLLPQLGRRVRLHALRGWKVPVKWRQVILYPSMGRPVRLRHGQHRHHRLRGRRVLFDIGRRVRLHALRRRHLPAERRQVLVLQRPGRPVRLRNRRHVPDALRRGQLLPQLGRRDIVHGRPCRQLPGSGWHVVVHRVPHGDEHQRRNGVRRGLRLRLIRRELSQCDVFGAGSGT